MAFKLTWSDSFPYERVQQAQAAWMFTTRDDVPSLTKFLTIRWKLCGYTGVSSPEDPELGIQINQAVLDFKKAASEWFRRNKTPWVHIGWRENPGDEETGEHLHMALHLPLHLVKPFDAFCRKFASKDELGRRYGSAIKITPKGDKLADLNLFGYLPKGADAQSREEYDPIIRRVTDKSKRKGQGWIYGQRVFISPSINKQAQGRKGRAPLNLAPLQPVGEETTYSQRQERKKLERQEEVKRTGSYMGFLRKRQAERA